MSTLNPISQKLEIRKNQFTPQVKKINCLLNAASTRGLGLTLLYSYLPHCSDEDFIENCVIWMQNCCKIDMGVKNNSFAIIVLDDLLKASAKYPELNKSVSFFITTRFLDYFLKYLGNSSKGWVCAGTCFSLYRGACGPYQESISIKLQNYLCINSKIPTVVANCFALLPSLGGGGNEGVNYRNNWKTEFGKYIQMCHSVLNDLFVDLEEFQKFETNGNICDKNSKKITVDALLVQLYNYCLILSHMLLNKYPVPKCVPTDSLLQMICRGLAVNPNNLGCSHTTNIITLKEALPEVHTIFHSLLTALIVTCRNQMLPYAHVVCKLIQQTLEWTECDFLYGNPKPYANLRVSVYDCLCNWLIVTRSSSCTETISKVVISSAISDIQSKKIVTLIKDSKYRKKKINEEPVIRRRVDPLANSELCCAALKALQFLIKCVGGLLKMEEHKFLQEVVVELLSDIQNSSFQEISVPYTVSQCRLGLYSLLFELTQQPSANWSPPTHFALRIFSRGVYDNCCCISQFCLTAINGLANALHCSAVSPESESHEEREGEKEVLQREEPMEVDIRNKPISDGDESEEPETNKRIETIAKADEKTQKVEQKLNSSEEIFQVLERQQKTNSVQVKEKEAVLENSEHKDEDKKVEKISYKNLKCEIFLKQESTSIEVLKKSENKDKEVKSKQNEALETLEKDEIIESVRKKSKIEPAEIILAKEKQEKRERLSPNKAEEPKSASTTPDSLDKTQEIKKNGDSMSEDDSRSAKFCLDDSRARKRYFLRSGTSKSPSEDSEDGSKSVGSIDGGFRTPTPIATITSSAKKKLKPRTTSKLKGAIDEEEKGEQDEDEDIIEAFHDSFVE